MALILDFDDISNILKQKSELFMILILASTIDNETYSLEFANFLIGIFISAQEVWKETLPLLYNQMMFNENINHNSPFNELSE